MENSGFAAIERTVLKRLNQTLRPELVARIAEKIVFFQLSFDVQRQIYEAMIEKERNRLERLALCNGHARNSRKTHPPGFSPNFRLRKAIYCNV
ncbi:MAG: hypothetical protein ACAI35_26560 [Candidatus Methylacidiphilales bacterium]|nr:hypothetical protein [Candidatus Methylacidiphilales bacterium]